MPAAVSEDLELAAPPENELRQRKGATPQVSSRPFAGRIGGNQEFIVDPSDSITEKIPDAAPGFSWTQSFRLSGFFDVLLWKEAVLEGFGTCLQVYLAGLYAIGLTPAATETSLGPITPVILASIANIILVTLFIYAGAPVSGGHFNPFITMSTFFARLSAFPRTILYVLFQCIGAVIAGFLVRASLGKPPEYFQAAPGCYANPALITPGQAYAIETMTALALIFLSFGVGLDPRQQQVFGPALSPFLVGLGLGLCTFATGFVKPGYSGASLNPARCLGLMAAAERFEYHYVHWFGDITAAIVNGIMYASIPPYKHMKTA